MKKSTKSLNKLCSLATILLIIGLIMPVSTVYASNLGDQSDSGQGQQPTATPTTGTENNNQTTNPTATPSPNATPTENQAGNSNESQQEAKNTTTNTPGVPDNALQCNKTDVIPVAQREQVRAQEPTLFRYRNMTMLMNCSRNCEVVFTADQEVSPKLLGLSVEPDQTMSLTMNLSKSPLQGAMVMQRSLNFYLGIEPNATLQFRAQIRLYINQTELYQELNRTVNASQLRWMFWNQTRAEWQLVESYMDQNGYLVCDTDHFSTWTVAEITQDAENSADSKSSNNLPIEYIIAGVVVAIIVFVLAVVLYKRRK